MTTHPVKRRKKLIEVAIPLEAINAASAQENERLRLFALISELVQWENTTNEAG
jgi:hypothetical protein